MWEGQEVDSMGLPCIKAEALPQLTWVQIRPAVIFCMSSPLSLPISNLACTIIKAEKPPKIL